MKIQTGTTEPLQSEPLQADAPLMTGLPPEVQATFFPREHNIRIYQDDSFSLPLRIRNKQTGEPIDLTGYDIFGQVRANFGSEEVHATFTVALLDQTNPALRGFFVLQLTPAQSVAMPVGKWRWDVQLTKDNFRQTYVRGEAEVFADASREPQA